MAKAATTATRKKTGRKPPHNPGAFLGLPEEASGYDRSRVVILPMPLEASVSYGGGTAQGPEAILTASQQVELYDPRRDDEPAMRYGIHTLPVPAVFLENGGRPDPAKALDAIRDEAAKHLAARKLVVGLGGEHTASLGMAKAVAETIGSFVLVHIDAHADLRDSYEDDPLSHASVVRRIAELPQCREILQLGIRSTSKDQADFAREHSGRNARPRIRTWYAWDMHGSKEWRRELRKRVAGKRVFLTFDVDGLDPAIVPATGTPEPDGLTWRQLMRIMAITAAEARVVALDCVELAPAPGLHHADFTVAKALYECISRIVLPVRV
ncbi:MAG: agmatinase [Planctomycetes bacterium]|nr:agmatinase [Planctomycetota bacterium]MCC8116228.1 agmatinase [Planctomycetota bacterium]MCD7895554.1 agmatinase [Planctomycetaceae bacterium]